MRPLCLRTVFSPAEYDVVADGRHYSGECIKDMRLRRKSVNMPVKGIVSSELIISICTDESFSPNAAVNVSSPSHGISVGTHFISRVDRHGSIITIHAFDRMRMTENDFRDDDYSDGNSYSGADVAADIASQCGFVHGDTGSPDIMLDYGDIHGKKCREILEFIAENCVGAWYCTDEEKLRFTPFLSPSVSVRINGDDTPLFIHSEKGPFEGIAAKNTATGEWFTAGNTSDHRKILKLSGRLFDRERTAAALTTAATKKWKAFYICGGFADHLPCGLTEYIYGERYGFIATETEVRFGAFGMLITAECPDICEDESDYTDAVGYELRKRIEEGRLYGNTVLTEKGIGITQGASEMRNADISFFSALGDRVTQFGGAMIDGVMPDSVTSISDREKLIRYGENVFRLTFSIGNSGEKTDIRLERVI